MVAQTEKTDMEATPVGMEAVRPSSAAVHDLLCSCARPPLLLRQWLRSGMVGRRSGMVGRRSGIGGGGE
ncbi:hypothetical protein KY289_020002 [Solanum tuberosum]|nr:hypothetical protein KY289_020002 [Solanum tuberosum]